jgi:uncharacterized membrane protein
MASQHHVENPFEFVIEKLTWGVSDIGKRILPHPERHLGQAVPQVRKITVADLRDVLAKAWDDIAATRDDILFIGVIYPVAGLILAALASGNDLLPMVFPLVSGFAILGPVAAVGLYEMSRRREEGRPVTWADAFGVLSSPALGSILGLGAVLLAMFGLWLFAAYQINLATLGPVVPPTLRAFEHDVFFTEAGRAVIVAGIGTGFLFALLAFAVGLVSFPLLLDRDVDMWIAVGTSFRAIAANPVVMAMWAAIVVGGLVLGSLPALVGLIIVMPLLGHATWHLYRKVVV